jgi:hypothetical protein
MSAAGAICAALGLVGAFTRACAQLNRVRSNPDAKISPHRNATATAAPRRAREKRLDILDIGSLTLRKVVGVNVVHRDGEASFERFVSLPVEPRTLTRTSRPTVSTVGRVRSNPYFLLSSTIS